MSSAAAAAGLSPSARINSSSRPYEVSQEQVDEIFRAAAQGDTVKVSRLLTEFALGWYSYDILRLSKISEYYGPLESNGDALISLLQTHEKGAVSANANMIAYLDEAVRQAEISGKPVSGQILGIIQKIKNKQDIGEEDAKRLYSWALEMKELVIPGNCRIEKVQHELDSLQDGYDKELRKSERMADAV
ncbi:MAG TPA: hypothetical protein VFV39_06455 [Limnobacter sp.]|nr:hypothetical protein [Limnobacter sp.]